MTQSANSYDYLFWSRVQKTHLDWASARPFEDLLKKGRPEDFVFFGFQRRGAIRTDAPDLGNGLFHVHPGGSASLMVDVDNPRLILKNQKWQEAAIQACATCPDNVVHNGYAHYRDAMALRYPTRAFIEASDERISAACMMIGSNVMLNVRSGLSGAASPWRSVMLLRDEGAPSYPLCWTPPGGNATEAPTQTMGKELNEELGLVLIDAKNKRYVLPRFTLPGYPEISPNEPHESTESRLRLRLAHWYSEAKVGKENHKYQEGWKIKPVEVQLNAAPWAAPFECITRIHDKRTRRVVAETTAIGFVRKPNVLGLVVVADLPKQVAGLDTSRLVPGQNCLPVDLEVLPNLPEGRKVGFLSAEERRAAVSVSFVDDDPKRGKMPGGLLDLAEGVERLLMRNGEPHLSKLAL